MPCGEFRLVANTVMRSALPSPSVSTHFLTRDRPILRSPLELSLYSSSPTYTSPRGLTAMLHGDEISGAPMNRLMTNPPGTFGRFGSTAGATGAGAGAGVAGAGAAGTAACGFA